MTRDTKRKALLIVLGALLLIGAGLATLAVPICRKASVRTREAVLKTNLRTMRDVIGQRYKDKGSYPTALETMVQEGYLRKVPMDPITRSRETWVLVHEDGRPGILGVKSGAPGNSRDGQPYKEW